MDYIDQSQRDVVEEQQHQSFVPETRNETAAYSAVDAVDDQSGTQILDLNHQFEMFTSIGTAAAAVLPPELFLRLLEWHPALYSAESSVLGSVASEWIGRFRNDQSNRYYLIFRCVRLQHLLQSSGSSRQFCTNEQQVLRKKLPARYNQMVPRQIPENADDNRVYHIGSSYEFGTVPTLIRFVLAQTRCLLLSQESEVAYFAHYASKETMPFLDSIDIDVSNDNFKIALGSYLDTKQLLRENTFFCGRVRSLAPIVAWRRSTEKMFELFPKLKYLKASSDMHLGHQISIDTLASSSLTSLDVFVSTKDTLESLFLRCNNLKHIALRSQTAEIVSLGAELLVHDNLHSLQLARPFLDLLRVLRAPSLASIDVMPMPITDLDFLGGMPNLKTMKLRLDKRFPPSLLARLVEHGQRCNVPLRLQLQFHVNEPKLFNSEELESALRNLVFSGCVETLVLEPVNPNALTWTFDQELTRILVSQDPTKQQSTLSSLAIHSNWFGMAKFDWTLRGLQNVVAALPSSLQELYLYHCDNITSEARDYLRKLVANGIPLRDHNTASCAIVDVYESQRLDLVITNL